jgi:glycosyltransferase involved in cell wall biosynthesis
LWSLPNVHFLGHIPHSGLPAYLHYCDVLLLPYTQSAFSQYINPAKLQECLAVGKPIVATELPLLREYCDVLRVASRGEFEPCVAEALTEGTNRQEIEKRRARARANTWEARFEEIKAHIAEREARI